ncbi:MAG: hypothetical protein ACTSRZ_05195 [Promethearchaeota archaeon]
MEIKNKAKHNRSKIFIIFFLQISGLILLISEFVPWISELYSPWTIIIGVPTLFESYYFYILPLISAVIIFIVTFIILIKKIFNNTALYLTLFLAMGIYLIFLIEMLSEHGSYLYNSPGLFLGIVGLSILFFGILWLLNYSGEAHSVLYDVKLVQEEKKEYLSKESNFNEG